MIGKNLVNICFMMLVLFCWCEPSFAKGDATIGALAKDIKGDIGVIAQLIIVIAYISGVAFALAGIVQFKAHKDSPTQTPLSKPMVLVIVGACLLFLPTVIRTAGESVLGSSKQSGDEAIEGKASVTFGN
jgi:intracellular multiplication protein IcmD